MIMISISKRGECAAFNRFRILLIKPDKNSQNETFLFNDFLARTAHERFLQSI